MRLNRPEQLAKEFLEGLDLSVDELEPADDRKTAELLAKGGRIPDPSALEASGQAHVADTALARSVTPPSNSLERTQPQRDFIYDVAVLRRSARGR